jgi:hypothetical protein
MGILNLNRKHKIEVEGYEFDIQIPTPGQIADIDIKVSKWMDGAKIESFPASTYEYLQMVQTLNTVITSYPPELTKLKSWSEIDDFEFLEGVYFAYLEKKKLFDEELKKNRDNRRALSNRNPSGPISNEELPSITEGSKQFIGLGTQAENVPIGSGFMSGHGQNQTSSGMVETPTNGGVSTSESVYARVNQESPASGRLL